MAYTSCLHVFTDKCNIEKEKTDRNDKTFNHNTRIKHWNILLSHAYHQGHSHLLFAFAENIWRKF